ncbi:MAG: D-2-hydroxyacid dehydrogenase [Prevotella sp.]
MNIVILDGGCVNPGDLTWEPWERLGRVTLYDYTGSADVLARSYDADALIINKVRMSAEVMDKLPKLKYIGVLATGYNVVDIASAEEHGVVVTNIPAYSTESVAQATFAHLLHVCNDVAHYVPVEKKREWCSHRDFCYWDTPLIELKDKTMGIVGLGNIGMKVAQTALSFGMKVVAFTSKSQDELPANVKAVSLDELLQVSDVVSLHCPLNDSTYRMINGKSLDRMKRNAILLNMSRGGLVDEDALAVALQSGRIYAYCADVLAEEPPRTTNPLLAVPNAYITPHLAWATKEARSRLMDVALSNIEAFIHNRKSGNEITSAV